MIVDMVSISWPSSDRVWGQGPVASNNHQAPTEPNVYRNSWLYLWANELLCYRLKFPYGFTAEDFAAMPLAVSHTKGDGLRVQHSGQWY